MGIRLRAATRRDEFIEASPGELVEQAITLERVTTDRFLLYEALWAQIDSPTVAQTDAWEWVHMQQIALLQAAQELVEVRLSRADARVCLVELIEAAAAFEDAEGWLLRAMVT